MLPRCRAQYSALRTSESFSTFFYIFLRVVAQPESLPRRSSARATEVCATSASAAAAAVVRDSGSSRWVTEARARTYLLENHESANWQLIEDWRLSIRIHRLIETFARKESWSWRLTGADFSHPLFCPANPIRRFAQPFFGRWLLLNILVFFS